MGKRTRGRVTRADGDNDGDDGMSKEDKADYFKKKQAHTSLYNLQVQLKDEN